MRANFRQSGNNGPVCGNTGDMSRTYPVQRGVAKRRVAKRRVVVMLVVGIIGLATVVLDVATAMDAGPAPEPVTRSHLVDGLPGPLNCMVTTGFSLACLSPSHF